MTRPPAVMYQLPVDVRHASSLALRLVSRMPAVRPGRADRLVVGPCCDAGAVKACGRWESRLQKGPQAMIALGSNVHIFAPPHRREALVRCFETVLGCGPVRTVDYPGINQPMLIVSFPGGGHLSIEFTDDAPDDEHARRGAWLELRADEPAAVLQAALDAGLTRVDHPGHPYYFMIPGGQVFTIASAS